MKHLLALLLAIGFCGCTTLQPGADPLVVRAEQAQRVAFDTFDTYVRLVALHEEQVKRRVPGAHQFAEWLRAKGPDGYPRGIALVKSLDATRRAYKSNRSSSNKASLLSAISALEKALEETHNHLKSVQSF